MTPMQERRSGHKSKSRDKSILLTPSQLRTLHSLEESGWHLCFIRRSYYLDSVPVLVDDTTGQTAIVDKAGRMETNHCLQLRSPGQTLIILH